MALRDQPYLPLYVQDFLTDEKLIECSASAHGIYIKIMCLMHKSETYGSILLRNLPEVLPQQNKQQVLFFAEQFAGQLARHLPFREDEICRGLTELLKEKVLFLEIGEVVFLSQKRMIKDNDLSLKRSKSGKEGAKKTNDRFAAANIPAKQSANSEYENEYENIKEIIRNIEEIDDVSIPPELENLYIMIVVKMAEIFKSHNPSYFFNKQTDYKACLEIAYLIAQGNNWKRDSVLNGNMPNCLKQWEDVVKFIKSDRWFSTRTLTDISKVNEWQRINQTINSKNTTNATDQHVIGKTFKKD
jgi:hypothetical protein